MKISVRKLEYVWHTIAFILLAGAFVPLWREISVGGGDVAEGDPVQRYFLAIAYLGVGLLIFQPRRAWRVARRGWLLWILIGWALLSTFWSIAPEITIRRSLVAILSVLYGLLLAVRYRPEEVLRILGTALFIIIMTSALALLLMPQWASVGSILQGGWRGVMVNKNVLGRTIGFAVIVFFILRKYVYRGRAKKIMLVGSIMAFVMLVGSRSVTSLFAVILAYLLLIVLSFQMRFAAYLRVAIFSVSVALLVPGMIMFVTYFEDILAVFGKNATLTGRIPLWSALLPYVMDRFWLGYGYGAFWASMGGPIVYLYRLFSWLPTHAHNGYLDVWIDIGIIGLFLTVLIFLKLIYYCVNEMMITGRKNYITVMIFFFVIYLNAINVTYNLMLEARLGGGIYWVVLSWMFMYVKSRKELGILHGGKL